MVEGNFTKSQIHGRMNRVGQPLTMGFVRTRDRGRKIMQLRVTEDILLRQRNGIR
jgi:hypothetical protein